MRKTLTFLTFLLFSAVWANAQTKEVNGKVTDSSGNAVSGATIRLKGDKKGVPATTDGSLKKSVPQNASLVITAVGFEPQEVDVSNNTSVNIRLRTAGSRVLDEVVVTALGLPRSK